MDGIIWNHMESVDEVLWKHMDCLGFGPSGASDASRRVSRLSLKEVKRYLDLSIGMRSLKVMEFPD